MNACTEFMAEVCLFQCGSCWSAYRRVHAGDEGAAEEHDTGQVWYIGKVDAWKYQHMCRLDTDTVLYRWCHEKFPQNSSRSIGLEPLSNRQAIYNLFMPESKGNL